MSPLVISFLFYFSCLSALVNLLLCLNSPSIFFVLFSSNKHSHTQPSLFPCLSGCHSQRTGLAGGVQLGSTNTWLSICLLMCAGMVFLFLCCSCSLINHLILWTCLRTSQVFFTFFMYGLDRHMVGHMCVLFVVNFVSRLTNIKLSDHLKHLYCQIQP